MAKPVTYVPSWDLLSNSVRLVTKHWYPFIYLVVLPSLLSTLGNLMLGEFITPSGQVVFGRQQLYGSLIIALAVVWTLINLGPSTLFEIEASRGKTAGLRSYYGRGLPLTFKLIGLYIMVGLAIVGGLFLLIVPGMRNIRKLILSPYYLVEKQLGVREAMRQSSAASEAPKAYIWGAIGVQFAVVFGAAAVSTLGSVGLVLGQLIGFAAFFIIVLRYADIERKAR